jgi:uncharacterized membrane protein
MSFPLHNIIEAEATISIALVLVMIFLSLISKKQLLSDAGLKRLRELDGRVKLTIGLGVLSGIAFMIIEVFEAAEVMRLSYDFGTMESSFAVLQLSLMIAVEILILSLILEVRRNELSL